jgi:hypothetical protein
MPLPGIRRINFGAICIDLRIACAGVGNGSPWNHKVRSDGMVYGAPSIAIDATVRALNRRVFGGASAERDCCSP